MAVLRSARLTVHNKNNRGATDKFYNAKRQAQKAPNFSRLSGGAFDANGFPAIRALTSDAIIQAVGGRHFSDNFYYVCGWLPQHQLPKSVYFIAHNLFSRAYFGAYRSSTLNYRLSSFCEQCYRTSRAQKTVRTRSDGCQQFDK